MMSTELENLKRLINIGAMFSSQMFSAESSQLLKERDDPTFEQAWLRVYAALQARGGNESAEVKEIRKAVYLKVYGLTQDPELAAYASEDFGLIATGMTMEYQDPWLDALRQTYLGGAFPGGSNVTPNVKEL